MSRLVAHSSAALASDSEASDSEALDSEALDSEALASEQTLAGYLQRHIDAFAGTQYIELDHAGRKRSQPLGELDKAAQALRQRIAGHGVDGSRSLLLCFESIFDFLPALWASIALSYPCLPWQAMRRTSDEDLAKRLTFLARKLDCPVLMTTAKLEERIARLNVWPHNILCTDEPAKDRYVACKGGSGSMSTLKEGALFMSTSGSTGDPKIAILSHPCLLVRERRLQSFRKPGQAACMTPFDTLGGLRAIIPQHNANIYIQPEYIAAQPLGLLRAASSLKLEILKFTTTDAARICDALEMSEERFDLSSIRYLGLGRERIVPAVAIKFFEALRSHGMKEARISVGYGATETGLIAWTPGLTIEEFTARQADLSAPPALGPVGPGQSLRFADDKGALANGERGGNIEVYSDRLMFSGYLDDPDANAQAFTPDGWFRTGDIGFMLDGELVVTGRKKSTLIVAGKNIALEPMETAAAAMGLVSGSLVAAMPVRQENSTTDELALFFAPKESGGLDAVCRDLGREIARRWGVSVRHFVPIPKDRFPLTRNGKIDRAKLIGAFQAGELKAYNAGRPRSEETIGKRSTLRSLIGKVSRRLSRRRGKGVARPSGRAAKSSPKQVARATEAKPESLAALWQRVLKLDQPPGHHDNFYDLGGDSLMAASLVFEVEQKYGCELALSPFFEDPTISRMEAQLKAAGQSTVVKKTNFKASAAILRKLQVLTNGWPGERPYAGSMVMGFNISGTRAPIYWVFQNEEEAMALATRLGEDQPLYALRSLASLPSSQYSDEALEVVGNRYLCDVLATSPGGPIVLGGNCQGGIVAHWLARRLKQMGRPPALLTLLEWTFSRGRYEGRAVLMYGRNSRTAKTYEEPETAACDWRHDFPTCVVEPVPAAHGQFFTDENIGALTAVIRKYAAEVTPDPPSLKKVQTP